eukprot:3083345-Pyramimonas_sp.AAC.1
MGIVSGRAGTRSVSDESCKIGGVGIQSRNMGNRSAHNPIRFKHAGKTLNNGFNMRGHGGGWAPNAMQSNPTNSYHERDVRMQGPGPANPQRT